MHSKTLMPLKSSESGRSIRLGNTGHHALVSPEDYERVRRHAWTAGADLRKPHLVYAKRLVSKAGQRRSQRLTHFILDVPFGVHVRHLNGDTLDCRRENLRVGGASVGINRRSRRNPFRVKCSYKNRQIMVGGFPTRQMADHAVQLVSEALLEINRGPELTTAAARRKLQEAAGIRVPEEDDAAIAA